MSETGAVRRRRAYVIGDGLSGGFWRRVVAFWIDHAVVGLALTVIGAVAFSLTDGAVRHSSPLIGLARCSPVEAATSRNTDRLTALPAGGLVKPLRPDRPPDRIEMFRCDRFPSNSTVRVHFVWDGRPRYYEAAHYPLQPSGRLTSRTFDLATLFFPTLLVWLTVSEAVWGAGPGKRIMRLRVIDRDGVRRARRGPVLVRNALLYGLPAVVGLAAAAHGLFGAKPGGPLFEPVTDLAFAAYGAAGGLWSLVVLVTVLAQRPDPFWDRWSGLSVRRRVWVEDG